MRNRPLAFVTLALLSAIFAGCISETVDDGETKLEEVDDPTLASLGAVTFSPKRLIDDVRAGGEPVIAVAKSGTIFVSSHPGWTHYHPSDPTHVPTEIITPFNAQSYLWKSTDGGATWTHVGLAGTEMGPRSTGFGVSDPEFTIMEDGTICYTDLEGLASSSVSCSEDDGETWIGNPIAAQRPNDRQWLASYGDELYFTANYFTDHNLIVSTDKGLTWQTRGDVPCSYDLVADPADGTLIVGCPGGIAVSTDGGTTWERRAGPASSVRRDMTEPAIDSAGNVWMAWASEGALGETIIIAGSPDRGATWPWVYDVGSLAAQNTTNANYTATVLQAQNATSPPGSPHVWPWISAGSEGRMAVTWIGTHDPAARTSEASDWHIFTAILVDATTRTPKLSLHQVSDAPIHQKAICQSGTTCQVSSMQGAPEGDRRLGDFFETTIDLEGNLHIVVSDTVERPSDVISHVAYFRQTGGLPLVIEGDRPPTQG